jgi:hypothetical protein
LEVVFGGIRIVTESRHPLLPSAWHPRRILNLSFFSNLENVYYPSSSKRHLDGSRSEKTSAGTVIMVDVGSAGIPTVGDIPRYHGKARPERVAISFEGRRLSYGDLDRRTNQIANALIAEGVRPQARIAILSKNSPAFFELWFGAAKVNVVAVPVNFRLAPPEVLTLSRMLKRSCCSSALISIR